MVTTTFLHAAELDQSSGNAEIDELLVEARQLTGRNYQVITRSWNERYGPFGLRRRKASSMGLYIEVGGVGPWQYMGCAQTEDTVRAFLLGVINGYNDGAKS